MTSNVPVGLPGADPSPIYVDGKPLSTAVDALLANDGTLAGHRHRSQNDKFWSTPPRPLGEAKRDVLEIDLPLPKLVNRLRYDLAHFPQNCSVEYWNGTAWSPVIDSHGNPVTHSIKESKPGIIAALTAVKAGHVHPQHFGSGHWLPREVDITPIRTTRIRWVFTRDVVGGFPPVNRSNQALDYSLALRNVALSYRITDRNHVPRLSPPDDSITTSQDIFGSPTRYVLRENAATAVAQGAIWKCEPQPTPDAVVSFHLNTLDANGDASVIDSFYLAPLHSGANVNIYFSNDIPSGTFTARDTPLVTPYASTGGPYTPNPTATGLSFSNAGPGWLSLDNHFIEWRPQNPWWFAAILNPQFASTDTAVHALFDFGAVKITTSAGAVNVAAGTSTLTFNETWASGATFHFDVAYDGTTLTVTLTVNGVATTQSVAVALATWTTDLRFGGERSDTNVTGDYLLTACVLKEGAADTTGVFFTAPDDYVTKAEFPENDTHTTDNALIRFAASLISTHSTYGFFGGTGDRYDRLVWSPIQRDFKVVKGYYQIPPTKARYFKFEFTNLTPEPYEVLEPVYRRVKVFPRWLVDRLGQILGNPNQPMNSGSPGATVNQLLAAHNLYPDQLQTARVYSNAINDERGYTPTEVQVATDFTVAQELAKTSYTYRFQAHQGTHHIPRWPVPVVHVYDEIEVLYERKVAYFVGLSDIQAFRVSYVAADDTEMYVELFYDAQNIATNTFQLDATGLLHTTSTFPVYCESQTFNSNRRIAGVQFSAIQTPPRQVLPDPDFDDPTLAHWQPVGDATLAASTDYSTWIGTTASVQRPATSTGMAGIRSADVLVPAPFGRIYGAARVIAPKTLTAPLWVQLVDNLGNVLAEEQASVVAGEVVEWYCGFTIGSIIVGSGSKTWDEMETANAPSPTVWDYYDEQFTWDEVTEYFQIYDPAQVFVRVVQKTATSDEWYMDTLSLFQDTIVWEFSNNGGVHFYPAYDIRNDPWGVLTFPKVGTEPGTTLTWRVKAADIDVHVSGLVIRPWYDGLLNGIPPRESINLSGPGQSPYDHYMPITDDPRWKLWHKPIPEEWWFFFRQFLMLQKTAAITPHGTGTYLGDPLEITNSTEATPIQPVLDSDALVMPTPQTPPPDTSVDPNRLILP